MSKSLTGMMFAVNPDCSSGTPLFKQLYEQTRESILAGRLRTGARLPASRTLVRDLGICRTTVLNALDQLGAEGYLRGRVGSGTRVVSMIPGALGLVWYRPITVGLRGDGADDHIDGLVKGLQNLVFGFVAVAELHVALADVARARDLSANVIVQVSREIQPL